jgi:hypothetical protein
MGLGRFARSANVPKRSKMKVLVGEIFEFRFSGCFPGNLSEAARIFFKGFRLPLRTDLRHLRDSQMFLQISLPEIGGYTITTISRHEKSENRFGAFPTVFMIKL